MNLVKMITTMAVAVTAMLLTSAAQAECIRLSTGDVLIGPIVEHDEDLIVMEHPVLGRLQLARAGVVAITADPTTESTAEPTSTPTETTVAPAVAVETPIAAEEAETAAAETAEAAPASAASNRSMILPASSPIDLNTISSIAFRRCWLPSPETMQRKAMKHVHEFQE